MQGDSSISEAALFAVEEKLLILEVVPSSISHNIHAAVNAGKIRRDAGQPAPQFCSLVIRVVAGPGNVGQQRDRSILDSH
jgi:hypothetical protein